MGVVVGVGGGSRTASNDAGMVLMVPCDEVEDVGVMRRWELVYLQLLARWRGLVVPRGRIVSEDALFPRRFRIDVGAGLFLERVSRQRGALACAELLSLLGRLGGGEVVVLVLRLGFEGY